MTNEQNQTARTSVQEPLVPFRVGYQGQPGSFGERAALRAGLALPYPSFERLLRALGAGEVERFFPPSRGPPAPSWSRWRRSPGRSPRAPTSM